MKIILWSQQEFLVKTDHWSYHCWSLPLSSYYHWISPSPSQWPPCQSWRWTWCAGWCSRLARPCVRWSPSPLTAHTDRPTARNYLVIKLINQQWYCLLKKKKNITTTTTIITTTTMTININKNLRHHRGIKVGDDHWARLVSEKRQQTFHFVIKLQ